MDLDGHPVAELGLEVQRILGPQLAAAGQDGEGGGVRAAEAVGQPVVLRVLGRHRGSDVHVGPGVLRNGAPTGLVGWEGGAPVLAGHRERGYRLRALAAAAPVRVGDPCPQVEGLVVLGRRVAAGRCAGDCDPAGSSVFRPRPLPGRVGHAAVSVFEGSRQLHPDLPLPGGEGDHARFLLVRHPDEKGFGDVRHGVGLDHAVLVFAVAKGDRDGQAPRDALVVQLLGVAQLPGGGVDLEERGIGATLDAVRQGVVVPVAGPDGPSNVPAGGPLRYGPEKSRAEPGRRVDDGVPRHLVGRNALRLFARAPAVRVRGHDGAQVFARLVLVHGVVDMESCAEACCHELPWARFRGRRLYVPPDPAVADAVDGGVSVDSAVRVGQHEPQDVPHPGVRVVQRDAAGLLHVGHGHGDVHRGGEAVRAALDVGGHDGELVDVVSAGVGRGFEIGRVHEGHVAATVDCEVAPVGPGQKPGDPALLVAGGEFRYGRRNIGLVGVVLFQGDGIRYGPGQLRPLVDVGHGHHVVPGPGVRPVIRLHRELVGVERIVIPRHLEVGRVVEGHRAVSGRAVLCDAEDARVVPGEAPSDLLPLLVAGGEDRNHIGHGIRVVGCLRVVGIVGRPVHLGRLVHVRNGDSDREFPGVVGRVPGSHDDLVDVVALGLPGLGRVGRHLEVGPGGKGQDAR